jgi:hypothetical protein
MISASSTFRGDSEMPWGWAAAALSLVGGLTKAAGQQQAGAAAAAQGVAEQEGDAYKAQEAQQQAGEAAAAGTQGAELAARDSAIALSNARARAGASGTTTSSEGVVNQLQRLAGRGVFSEQQQVAKGATEAQNLENQVNLDLFEGTDAAQQGADRNTVDQTDATAQIFDSLGSSSSEAFRVNKSAS